MGHCIGSVSVAMIKHHAQKQLMEGRVCLNLQLQTNSPRENDSQSRELRGHIFNHYISVREGKEGPRLTNSQSPQWCTFANKALPPQIPTTSPKKCHPLRTKRSNTWTCERHLSFRPPQPCMKVWPKWKEPAKEWCDARENDIKNVLLFPICEEARGRSSAAHPGARTKALANGSSDKNSGSREWGTGQIDTICLQTLRLNILRFSRTYFFPACPSHTDTLFDFNHKLETHRRFEPMAPNSFAVFSSRSDA